MIVFKNSTVWKSYREYLTLYSKKQKNHWDLSHCVKVCLYVCLYVCEPLYVQTAGPISIKSSKEKANTLDGHKIDFVRKSLRTYNSAVSNS